MYRLTIQPLTILLLLSIAACARQAGTPEPASTQSRDEVLVPTEEESQDRYISKEGAFSLRLPDGWQVFGPVEAAAGGGISFALYNLGPHPSTSMSPGGSSIAIADADTLTVEEFIQGQCSPCPPATVNDIQLGNVSARRAVIGDGGVPLEITWTFFEHNGRLIGLKIHDPQTLEPLSEVLESIELR
ncbi:MAG: hypothetical protein P1P76_00820 [Anaerolineales bacterium]|nr:hypothetical protein [Anaerolineales bacterium]